MADPGTEPEFTVLLSADQISVNKTVTMLVALTKELSWKLDSSETLQTGTPSTFQITITNTGNSLVSGTIEVQSPSEISVEIEGADIVNLDAGQSQKVRLMVTSNAPGSEVVKLSISGVDDVTGSSFELQVSSEGDKISDGSSSIGNTLLWSFLILIPLLAIIPVVTILRSRQNKTSAPNQAPPNAAAFAVDQAQQVTTPCFSCRQPILSGMLGCPSCGARYHSVCNVNTCVNCGAEASTFVNA
jgi:VCBS repeat-containing protein